MIDNSDYVHAIALRRSGIVDLYYNSQLEASS